VKFFFVFRCDATVRVSRAVYKMLLYRWTAAELPSKAFDRKCYEATRNKRVNLLP
jgi:hypothetical protein